MSTFEKTMKIYPGIYLNKNTETNLKDWCKLTQQSYGTVHKRFIREMKKSPFKNKARVDLYQNFVFYLVINKSLPFDELVIPSIEDFAGKIFLVIREHLPPEISYGYFTQKEAKKLRENLDCGFTNSELLELILQENDVDYSPELLEAIKADYVADNEDTDSNNIQAFRYGQQPKVVKDRVTRKKWSLEKALTTVNY